MIKTAMTTVAASALLISTAGAAQMPQNIPAPPPGFNASNATKQELQHYGFPAKPVDHGQPDFAIRLKAWQEMVSPKYKRFQAKPRLDFHGIKNIHMGMNWPAKKIDNSILGSYNWAGPVMEPGDFEPWLFVGPSAAASGGWTIPTAQLAQSVGCQDPGEFESDWVGIGGSDPNSFKLEQTGSFTGVDCNGNSVGADFWVELAGPQGSGSATFLGTNAQPGDNAYCQVNPDGGSDNFFCVDYTQGFTTALSWSDNNPDGSSAEAIKEAPYIGGTQTVLPQNVGGIFYSLSFTDGQGNSYGCDDPNIGNQIWMVSPYTGELIVTSQCLDSSTDQLDEASDY